MELRHLRYFVAIVDHREYREASRHLHVSQPALTQAVVDLEVEIGRKLLVRGPQKNTLTIAGESFCIEAKQTLLQADRTVEAAKRASKGILGSFRIGYIPGATNLFMPELLQAFARVHPNIEVDLEELAPATQIRMLERLHVVRVASPSKLEPLDA